METKSCYYAAAAAATAAAAAMRIVHGDENMWINKPLAATKQQQQQQQQTRIRIPAVKSASSTTLAARSHLHFGAFIWLPSG
ncbi:unnamed protein product [Ceratitis capitata]|uniref:(Mediterranean fruit fly) hypothetical protein n=1 Tax=Ceratitis capitata TaxID=7213 RepID=A0A811U3K0_CERCA|nr:unnamed protein product [Ceratitis capitata]